MSKPNLRDLKRSSSSGVSMSIAKLLSDIAAESGTAGVASAIVNLLEPLEFEIQARLSRGGSGDLRYVLTVHHRYAKAMWKHHRSFDEYEMLHRNALQAMHHGHFCNANCPWLESFLTSSFPQATLLISDRTASLVEKRVKTLLVAVQTLQKFLVNRVNHVCYHVVNELANVFLDFIYGDVIDSQHVLDHFLSSAPVIAPELKKPSRRRTQSTSALASATSTTAPRSSLVLTDLRKSTALAEEPELCTLCGETLPVKDLYVVHLRCGHRFHDECAMPALNQELKCPTCGLQLTEIP